MTEPLSLNPAQEINEFLSFLYEDQTGWSYSPYKEPDGTWVQKFFEWPSQSKELISHVTYHSEKNDVYISPSLFTRADAKKENVKGSHVLWAEFDGSLPPAELLGSLPQPSRRLRSSEDGHEHWYWKLDYFEESIETIERANRGLTYQLLADSSGWDANQILRPPATLNHKRNKPVLTLYRSEATISPGIFSEIPIPPVLVNEDIVERIPDTLDVIFKYPLTVEFQRLFTSKAVYPYRSKSLMKVAYFCAEAGMNDSEIYSMLRQADDRWGKFKERRDRPRRLLDIINHARIKFPLGSGPTEDALPLFGFSSLLATDIEISFVIEGLLQERGYMLLTGMAGVGKTQMSLRFAACMAIGKDFLEFKIDRPMKSIFFSLEMGHADVKYFLNIMSVDFTDEEKELLEKNMLIVPLGESLYLDDGADRLKVEHLIKEHEPVGVFFDSVGSTTSSSVSDENTTKKLMDWNDRLRSKYNIFTWFIHHQRKANGDNKKPNKLADVYGSIYLVNRATSVYCLWDEPIGIAVIPLKKRLSKMEKPFLVKRTDTLNFFRSSGVVEKEETIVPEENGFVGL